MRRPRKPRHGVNPPAAGVTNRTRAANTGAAWTVVGRKSKVPGGRDTTPVGGADAGMSERRLRTSQKKRRARARFWDDHGEKIRLGLIAAGMVVIASWIAKTALGG